MVKAFGDRLVQVLDGHILAKADEALAGRGGGMGACGRRALGPFGESALPRAHLFLVYPMTDATSSMESHRTNGKGYLLEQDDINWFHEQYLVNEAQARDPRVSPYYAPDVSGVAPAIVLVAGFDPLRDEGIAYAERLRKAGVRVDLRCEDSLIHGWWSITGVVEAAHRSVTRVAGAIRRELLHSSA